MAFTPLTFTDGTLRNQAALEHCAPLTALYWNRQDKAQLALNAVGGGEITHWLWQPNSWPPSWSVLRQGDRYYLYLAGTTNAGQWLMHFAGAPAAIPYSGDVVLAHSLWLGVWSGMSAAVRSQLPASLSGKTLTIIGHSYGGALAQLAANDYAALMGAENVNLLTYAQPRPLTGGYTGAQPHAHIRIVHQRDIVPAMPPAPIHTVLLVGIQWRLGFSHYFWVGYGRKYLLGSDGSLFPSSIPDDLVFIDTPDALLSFIPAHEMSTYARSLVANAR